MPQVALALDPRVDHLAAPPSFDGTLGRCWSFDRALATSSRTDVYAATHVRGHRAAIKVLRDGADDERFLREIAMTDVASAVGSPALRGYGVSGESDGYLVLDLLEGGTLEQHSALRGGRFDLATALLVAERLLVVAEELHGAGVVHRDIRPANVFITHFADVRLLDYSEAARVGAVVAGDFRGIEGFAPPEQQSGREQQADPRVDVYAVGAVLYWMLSGSARPIAEWNRGAVANLPLDAIAHLPADVMGFLELALTREPQRRVASARVMRGLLSGMRAAFGGLDSR